MVLSMANPWKHRKTGVYYRRAGSSRQHCQRRKSREAAPWSRGPVRDGGQPGRHLRRSSRADWQSPPVDRHRRPPAHGALLRGIGAIEAAATAYREKIFAATDDQFAAVVSAISARLREMLEATSYSTREFVDLIFLINRTSIRSRLPIRPSRRSCRVRPASRRCLPSDRGYRPERNGGTSRTPLRSRGSERKSGPEAPAPILAML